MALDVVGVSREGHGPRGKGAYPTACPAGCAENTDPWESVAEGGEAYEMMRAGGLCVECRRSQIVGVHEGCPESW